MGAPPGHADHQRSLGILPNGGVGAKRGTVFATDEPGGTAAVSAGEALDAGKVARLLAYHRLVKNGASLALPTDSPAGLCSDRLCHFGRRYGTDSWPEAAPTTERIYLGWFNDPDISQRFMASAAAVLQLGVTVAALLCWWLLEQLIRSLTRYWLINGSRQRGEIILRLVGRSALLFSSITALAALVGLGLFSLAGFWRFPEVLPQMLTLDHWQRSGPMLATPLINTALIGLVSTALATALVLATLENEHRQHIQPKRALWLLYLPLLVPQIAFLFGLIVAAESLGIRPQLGLVIAGHLLFVLPYVYLSLAETYRQLDPRWLKVARSLGVSRSSAFWRVRLPLLLAPLLTAFAVGLAVSIGQYLPTSYSVRAA